MSACRRLVFATAVLAVVLLGGCGRPATAEAEPEDAPPAPVPVRAARVRRGALHPSLDLVGTLVAIPEKTAVVSAQTPGRIVAVPVVEGQWVEAGQVLVQLDPRPAQAELAAAEAALHQARATLARLEYGPRRQEIAQARERTRQLEAQARALEAKFAALSELHERGELSDVEYQQARARLEAAQAEARAARQQLSLLEAGTRPEQIDEARSAVAAAAARVDAARLGLEFCTIRAPSAGIVTQLAARLGAWVNAGQTLAMLADTRALFAKVRIPAAVLSQVTTGLRADVRVEGGQPPLAVSPATTAMLPGILERLAGQADPQTGDLDAFVRIDNPDRRLRPNQACRVRLWLAELAGVLIVPVEAVADRHGTAVVTVIRDNKAYETPVRLGRSTRRFVQVLDGLAEGDLVATEGGYGLPEGCPVRIVGRASQATTTRRAPR